LTLPYQQLDIFFYLPINISEKLIFSKILSNLYIKNMNIHNTKSVSFSPPLRCGQLLFHIGLGLGDGRGGGQKFIKKPAKNQHRILSSGLLSATLGQSPMPA
jgi:hypothetical protein